jgi:putative addiction module component (TIGR02574 family)
MSTVLDINRLTRTEKLRAMEELWEDLSQSETEYESPEWHGEMLRAREEDIRAGRDEFVPWEEAKRILRERTK